MAMNDAFVWNLFTISSGFSPVIALLVERLHILNQKKFFLVSQICFASLIVYVLGFLPIIKGETLPTVLVLYPSFLFMLNQLFYHRFGIKNYSKGLSLSILLTFVLTEIHEIPAFVEGYLSFKFLISPYEIFCALAPIYALVALLLAAKIAKLKLSLSGAIMLILGVAILFPLYYLNPQLDLSMYPSLMAFVKRIFWFFLLSTIFYRWSGVNHANT